MINIIRLSAVYYTVFLPQDYFWSQALKNYYVAGQIIQNKRKEIWIQLISSSRLNSLVIYHFQMAYIMLSFRYYCGNESLLEHVLSTEVTMPCSNILETTQMDYEGFNNV